MKQEKETLISIILQIIMAFFATILIIQLILKLTGHSPTETQILIGSIVAIITYLIGASYKIMYKLGRIDQHLISLDKNIAEINSKLEKIDQRFDKIDKKFERMERGLLHIERKIS